MTVYVALLRGINVGGKKTVKMEKLRGSFEALGFDRVRTYVNSGNVIFETSSILPTILAKRIGEKVSEDFGFPIRVIAKTSGELNKIVRANPFLRERGIDRTKLHVTFLSEEPATTFLRKLDTLKADPDKFHVKDCEIYLYCPNGYGRTKLFNSTFERLLLVDATTRNWRTASILAEMSLDRNRA